MHYKPEANVKEYRTDTHDVPCKKGVQISTNSRRSYAHTVPGFAGTMT
jgi:hypothetical protein